MSETTCPACERDDFATVKGMKSHHKMTHGESIAGEEGVCEWCGESFRYHPSKGRTGKTCSSECLYALRSEEGMDEEFKQAVSQGKPKSLTEEHRQAIQKALEGREIEWADKVSEALEGIPRPDLRGENNPNWKGGYEPYYGGNWREVREEVLERDGNQCRICGCGDGLIDVHHITPIRKFDEPENANTLDNLIVLCRPCHVGVENGKKGCPEL